MFRAVWVLVVMVALVALMGLYHVNRLKACWDSKWMVEIGTLLLPVGFLGFVLGTFLYSIWLRLVKPLVGPTSRWRQQTSSLLALLMLAAVVFHAYQRLSEPDFTHEQGVILPYWNGREPTLLARLHPRSSLTSWVGPEALPDFLAGQSSPRVMLRMPDDSHAPQYEATATAVSSGLLEVAPTLSASTLGRFQPPGPPDCYFGRVCQVCCKPHELQQQLQPGWFLHSAHPLAPLKAVCLSCLPSNQIGVYLASRSLSAQQLLLHQAEYVYITRLFRFASLAMSIREAQGQYAAQCVWSEQRTSLAQLFQGLIVAPLDSIRATQQQQLPGKPGLALNSMSSSPSAWVWSQTPRLATFAGKLSAEPMAPRCRNTSVSILEQADFEWRQAWTSETDFINNTQSCHCLLGSRSPMTVQQEFHHQHNGTPKGSISPAPDNTLPAIVHRPYAPVPNVIRDIGTGVGVTLRLTQGSSELPVLRLAGHMHSGAATAILSSAPTCGVLLLPLLVSDSRPCSRTAIIACNDEGASLALSLPSSSSSEVHGLTCHLHCGILTATKLLDSSRFTAFVLLTVHNASDLWAGSFLAGPEANLRLVFAAVFNSQGCSETHVHGLTSHMHSGAAMAVSSKCGILHMPLLPPNINPFNSIQATNDEKAPLALAFPSNDSPHVWMQVVPHTTSVALHPDVLQQEPLTPITIHHLLEEDATNPLWVVALLFSFSLHITLLVLQKSGCFSRILGLKVDWLTGVYRGSEIGTTRKVLNGAAHMAIEIYRMYMDERLLAQLDRGACIVYFEILLGKNHLEEPVSDAFDVGHCMSWAELSQAEKAWFYSTTWGRAKLACQPPLFEPTAVDVLRREAEENYLGMKGGKPADCKGLRSSPSQLSSWCGRRADLILKGSMYR